MSKHLPYMPFYVSDHEAKTSHLTLIEDGVYSRLLRLCWLTPGCKLPNDEKWIARRMRVSELDFYELVAPMLDEFFHVERGRVFEPDLLAQWIKSKTHYDKKVEAGRKGGKASQKANPLKIDDLASSNAQATKTKTKTKTNNTMPNQERETLNSVSSEIGQSIDDNPFKRSANG